MARKREQSVQRKMKKVFLVVCEGETEEVYVDLLRQKYRSPIKIVSKISGNEITQRKLECYKNDLKIYGNEAITTFLMYDMDVKSVVQKLQNMNANLLLSNPCIEIWFLLHFKDMAAEINSSECLKQLIESDKLWHGYKKSLLTEKQQDFLWQHKTDAVTRAKKLAEFKNPSSSIYKLLDELEK